MQTWIENNKENPLVIEWIKNNPMPDTWEDKNPMTWAWTEMPKPERKKNMVFLLIGIVFIALS